VSEASFAVFVGAAGRLHDAVKSQEGSYNQLSHFLLLLYKGFMSA
jgi:hypothetical protein